MLFNYTCIFVLLCRLVNDFLTLYRNFFLAQQNHLLLGSIVYIMNPFDNDQRMIRPPLR